MVNGVESLTQVNQGSPNTFSTINDRENSDGSEVGWLARHCTLGDWCHICLLPFCGDFTTSQALVVQLSYARL